MATYRPLKSYDLLLAPPLPRPTVRGRIRGRGRRRGRGRLLLFLFLGCGLLLFLPLLTRTARGSPAFLCGRGLLRALGGRRGIRATTRLLHGFRSFPRLLLPLRRLRRLLGLRRPH